MIYSSEAGGSHGQYWTIEELARRFEGPEEIREANRTTHEWRTRDSKTSCVKCNFSDYETEADYLCGATDIPHVFILSIYVDDDPPVRRELERPN